METEEAYVVIVGENENRFVELSDTFNISEETYPEKKIKPKGAAKFLKRARKSSVKPIIELNIEGDKIKVSILEQNVDKSDIMKLTALPFTFNSKDIKYPIIDNNAVDYIKSKKYKPRLKTKKLVEKKTGEKTKCIICSKFLLDMRSHLSKTHNKKEKCHICDKCGATFKTRSAIKAHLNAHIGFKPFKCDECHFSYTSNGALKVHKKKHLTLRHFCETCGRSYTRKDSLKFHVRTTHEEGLDHECNKCHESFTSFNDLNTHKKEVHSSLFRCSICNAEYKLQASLKYHLRTKHNIQLMSQKQFYNKLPQIQT